MIFSMLQYIAPPDFALSVAKNKLHSMIIVGSMGSGKTTWTLSLIARAIEELLNSGKDDKEIAIIHSIESPMSKAIEEIKKNMDLNQIKYLYWFSDDAPATKGMHSRRSMSEENITETQFYIMIRHRLEKLGFNGFIFIAHATQVYNLVDITFRRLSKIKAFKDYPDEPSDLKIIGPMLGKAYLRKLADITYKIWAPRNKEELIEGLSSAIVKFIRKKKKVTVEKRTIPDKIQYLRIEPEPLENENGNMENRKRDRHIEYEIREKGLKPVLRGNTLYIYKRNNGKLKPLLKIKWKN